MRITALAAAVLAVGALALNGCARDVETEVTRFHGGHLPAEASFAVLPENPDKAGPEFDTYAEMIAEEMTAHGFSRSEPEAADLHARVDYDVSEGRTKIESRPGHAYPYYSYRLGYHRYPFSHSFYHPHHYGGHLGPDIRSETVYTRKLTLKIRDTAKDETVFEGRALSEGRTQEISKIMPYLVESMFRNFPGESGTTKVVEIETKNGNRY